MKKSVRKISIILALLMITSCLLPFANAKDKKRSVTIFIDGINSEDIIDKQTGEVVYPPSGKDITNVVMKSIPVVTKALLTGRHEIIVDPIAESMKTLFAPVVVDENGYPAEGTVFNYNWPSKEQIREYIVSERTDKQLKYAFDWRLDMITVAEGLHDFIEYVMEAADADSVSLIGCSMGSCALLSYLKIYDYEYVDSAIVYVGGVNGTNTCGEPFSGDIAFNSESIVRYVDSMLGENIGGVLVSSLLHNMKAMGLMEPVVKFSDKLTKELNDAVYEKLFSVTFGCVPGMWSLVPLDKYEKAKELNGSSLSDEMLKRVDWYHYEVQAKSTEIMQGCLDRGIKTAIISKYGYPGIPCITSADEMTDSMIDTKYSSFGATVAEVNTNLGIDYVQKNDNGKNCVSPDLMIDSSTCSFCDYTWFIKNSKHSDDYAVAKVLFDYIIETDEQVNVWNGEYPQYLILENNSLVALTAENNKVNYPENFGNENIFNVFVNTVKRLFEIMKLWFGSLFNK